MKKQEAPNSSDPRLSEIIRKKADLLFSQFQILVDKHVNYFRLPKKECYQTRDDIRQELNLKLYNSIVTYLVQSEKYKNGERRYKLMPLNLYLSAALSNRNKDFIKKQENSLKNPKSFESDFDFGTYNDLSFSSKIDFDEFVVIINGVDLLQFCKNKNEKIIFCMYLKGYEVNFLTQIFIRMDVKKLIDFNVSSLKQMKSEFFNFYFSTFKIFKQNEI